jgi:hypothetical protein
MSKRPQLVARIALFSALIYVLSWGTAYLPNFNFIFFVVFSAGFLWGLIPGILVGAVGMGLWTLFNPFGPAPVPIMIAQIVGASGSGVVGALFRMGSWQRRSRWTLTFHLMISALLCTLLFYMPVNAMDAALFQPFWPRFLAGAVWAAISCAFNLITFPLLFTATRYLYLRESAVL